MFNRLFKLFNKNIVPLPEQENYMIFKHRVKGGKLRINSSVEVPPATAFLVIINGKIYDVLSSGRHRVNGSTMPGVFDKLKLGVPNKKGKLKKHFKADVYYVNLKLFSQFQFNSETAFHLRSEEFGRVKGYAEGVADVSVTNPEEIMKYLLKHVNVVKPKYSEKEIGLLIGNVVNKFMEKSKVRFTDILLQPKKLNKQLNPAVDDLLYEVGIGADNVSLTSLRLAKRTQKKVSKFMQENVNLIKEEPDYDAEEEKVLVAANEVPAEVSATQSLTDSFFDINDGSSKHKLFSTEEVRETALSQPSVQQEQPQSVVQNAPIVPQNVQQSSDDISSYFAKRNSSAELINKSLELKEDEAYESAPKIDAENILKSDVGNKKQCKYCSSTIDKSAKFCPKCGFKQAV